MSQIATLEESYEQLWEMCDDAVFRNICPACLQHTLLTLISKSCGKPSDMTWRPEYIVDGPGPRQFHAEYGSPLTPRRIPLDDGWAYLEDFLILARMRAQEAHAHHDPDFIGIDPDAYFDASAKHTPQCNRICDICGDPDCPGGQNPSCW